jgi:hypothetical protein
MPLDEEIIRKALEKNNDVDISLVTSVIPICKKNFKKRNLLG